MTTWTRRERFKVVGVHVVVGSGTLAHVVSLVAIIVTVIDHKVLVTRDWSRHVHSDTVKSADDTQVGKLVSVRLSVIFCGIRPTFTI